MGANGVEIFRQDFLATILYSYPKTRNMNSFTAKSTSTDMNNERRV